MCAASQVGPILGCRVWSIVLTRNWSLSPLCVHVIFLGQVVVTVPKPLLGKREVVSPQSPYALQLEGVHQPRVLGRHKRVDYELSMNLVCCE